MRRFITAGALVALTFVPLSASAGQSWEDISTQTALAALDSAPLVSVPPTISGLHATMRPDTAAPPFIIGFVAAGAAQTGVPCFSCVNGAQTSSNIGLTAPYNYIATGEVAQYVSAFTNLSNTGNCTFSWAIASGKTKIDAFSYVFKNPGVNSSYVLGFNRNHPTVPAATVAVLTAKIACAGNGSQTTKTTLFYQ